MNTGRSLRTRSGSRSLLSPSGLLVAVLLLLVPFLSREANADSVTFSGPTSFSVGYSFLTPGGSSLTATGTYDVTSFSSTEVVLGVTINNTTPNYVVSAVGFNTNPAVTASFSSLGSRFGGIGNDTTFPGFQTIQVCAFTSSNCSSSANGQALQPNASDSFGLKLTGNFNSALTLSTFAIKFAGGPEGSFEFQGKVPVPGTLLLFGASFILFVTWHRHARGPMGVVVLVGDRHT